MSNLDIYHPDPNEGEQELSAEKRKLSVRVEDLRKPYTKSAFDLDKFILDISMLAADGEVNIPGYGKLFQIGKSESEHFRKDIVSAKEAAIVVSTGFLGRALDKTRVIVRLQQGEGMVVSYTFVFKEDGTYYNYSMSNFQESKENPLPESGAKKLGPEEE